MSFEEIDSIFEVAVRLAKEAGEVIKEAFYSEKTINTKSCDTDLVTETDKKVEKIVFDKIRETFPNHECIGEETTSESGAQCTWTDKPTWIIDPIDGTTNFVHKFPYVAICIGVTINKVTQVGIVFNPILNELFTAKKGHGAFLNGKKISVSNVSDFHKSMIMTECGSSRNDKIMQLVFQNMQSVLCAPIHAVHSLGSAALNMAMVAQGSAEAYYETGIHCWDYCAAGLIVEEAGGVTIDTAGGELDLMRRRIIAANNMNIAQNLSKRLEQIELPRD